jgi:hypothetical protein
MMTVGTVSSLSRTRHAVIALALAILCVHGGLLLATIKDWRVTIDSAYHVSMARAYATHFPVRWDHINFGPAGRPNLQAPLLYIVVGALGRAMGGNGSDFVLANAVVAVLQWAAAMGTASFFALTLGGEWAMLLAAALLSGAGFAATSFAVGIPSGWLFIAVPWAIHFFLKRRLVLATLFVAAAIYVHVAGLLVAPLGILAAALLCRRWRDLMIVGACTALITAPYTVHLARYVGWFSGVRSYSALLFDPMLDVLGIAGLFAALRQPRRNAMLIAWTVAPIAWLFQDPGRFVLQSGLAASVLGGVWIASMFGELSAKRRALWAATIGGVATLCPFGVPAIAAETAWAAGAHYPRALDWQTARALAGVIRAHGLQGYLVADYQPSFCPAIAVYGRIVCEKGHWVEVQPRIDPADALSAASKIYVLPLEVSDPALEAMVRDGWVRVWGGSGDSSVVTLAARPALDSASAAAGQIVASNAAWLSAHAKNNSLDGTAWLTPLRAAALRAMRRQLANQRARAGRIELALLVYAYALEPGFPAGADRVRRAAGAFGVIASFLGDDLALDYETEAATARLRWRFGLLSSAADSMREQPPPDVEFERALLETIEMYLVTGGGTFSERPPGDALPWIHIARRG